MQSGISSPRGTRFFLRWQWESLIQFQCFSNVLVTVMVYDKNLSKGMDILPRFGTEKNARIVQKSESKSVHFGGRQTQTNVV